ncbi:phenylalanine--tRNA ligase subunit alpha [Candidatus Pacearchaeota archaeon]|nr:phenylalanine--tRNA ligase subunit alpha [Candidatus Pacearchaeota archaeon]
MDEKLIVESLSPMEKGVLPELIKDFLDIESVSKKSRLDKTTVLRAVGLLEKKGLVEVESSEVKRVDLGILGINYLKKELPERTLLNRLNEKKVVPIGEIRNVCGLNENEAKVALGVLKKKALIEIDSGKVKLAAKGDEVSNKMIEEIFMEKLPLALDEIVDLDALAFENLRKRKDVIEVIEGKIAMVRLTDLGVKISDIDLNVDMLEALTPKMLKGTGWKGKKFRRYDLGSPISRIYGGKRHFVNQATDYAKSIWLEMGFKEMTGNMAETGFWVFDSLFTAQDHPVREMQDTFYLEGMVGKLPTRCKNKKDCMLSNIQKAHEGGINGSKGWQYKWDEEDAKKILLRTHTTCLSIKKLWEIGKTKEFPAKYFALGKCFRNETVDWSHGFEFNQTEGIVVDENANFRQLLGYLKQFFGKMGYEKIRIRPAYFAYTEPSLEIDVWHPVHEKWLELGGAGMFRPEVTIPMFGRHIPVLAWGPGFDRMIMEFFGINDLREMYKNDLNKLREMKFWLRQN